MALNTELLKKLVNVDGIKSDLKSQNFGIYGKWIGILSVILALALGISNIFRFDLIIIFSIIAIVFGILVLLVEVPFLLKICPFNAEFSTLMKRFNANWPRVGFYAILAIVQWLSLIVKATSLLVLAILWTICAVLYALSAFAHQEFHNGGSSDIGGGEIPASAIRQIL